MSSFDTHKITSTKSTAEMAATIADSTSPASAGEEVLNQLLQRLQAESPKIDQSVKNLLSIILADPVTHSDHLTHSAAFACAKVFLKALSSFELLPIDDFCIRFPQGEGQDALHRLDEICQYKAVYAYYSHIQQHASVQIKVSKRFGRSFFLWSRQWSALRDAVALKAAEVPKEVTPEHIEYFLNMYEKSIFSPELANSEADLIWAQHFETALRLRQQQRVDAVQKRLEEVDLAAKEQLTSLLQAVQSEPRDAVDGNNEQDEEDEESRVEELAE